MTTLAKQAISGVALASRPDPNGPRLLHQNRRSHVHWPGKGHVMNMPFAAGDLVEFTVGDLILSLDDKRRWAWVLGGHLLSPFG